MLNRTAIGLVWLLMLSPLRGSATEVEILSVEKIWDQEPHSAFTDLVRWNNRWYCTFREADAHVGGRDGVCRVLSSPDGVKWESVATISEKGVDLRDPKLSITPDGRLMLTMGGSIYEGRVLKGRQSRVAFSNNGVKWTEPKKVGEPDGWLWRVTWHNGTAYGLMYTPTARPSADAPKSSEGGQAEPAPAEWKLTLVSSSDGENYKPITQLDVPGQPNEATIRFLPDDRMIALIRREGGDKVGWVGLSSPPYKEWSYKPLPRRIGGPNFLQLPDGRFFAVTRKYEPTPKTVLSQLDPDKGTLDDLAVLPSGGDTSYAGLAWHDRALWISYYSSHEDPKRSRIYLARVSLPTPPPESLIRFFSPPPEFVGDLGSYRSPLLFQDGSMVKNAEDWARRRQEILKIWHDLMGPWPELIEKPKVEVLGVEKRGKLTQSHVRIEVAPGKTNEDAYLLVPEGQGPFPAVIVVYYDGETGIGRGKKAELRDHALQMAQRGFVALSLGSEPRTYYPNKETCKLQPLSYHAYEAANCYNMLANRPDVDPKRIGILGHSYGGKWAMFASCLYDKFATAVWSDPGIVFDEKRPSVNYWEPWYLGFEPGVERQRGLITPDNPRTGPYKRMIEEGRDLHELHALMAPRPFLVSGGSEDFPARWKALNHALAVNKLLGKEYRVAMTNRPTHTATEESNQQMYTFLEWALKTR